MLMSYRLRARGVEWVYACALVGGMLATPYVHLDDLVMLGLGGWLVLRARSSLTTTGFVLLGVLAIEGEPIWGPLPVVLVEIGALALLSAEALRREPASAPLQPAAAGRSPQPTTLR
jgi:hypothetical protein